MGGVMLITLNSGKRCGEKGGRLKAGPGADSLVGMKSLKMLTVVTVVAGVVQMAGCTQNARRSPALAQPTQTGPEKKDLLSRTADTTWNVVSAPVRWVSPNKKPDTSEQETSEPADAVIMTPDTK